MIMSLFFEDFHLELQKSVRRFAETELKPVAEELDEKQGFNHQALKKLGEMGLLGVTADALLRRDMVGLGRTGRRGGEAADHRRMIACAAQAVTTARLGGLGHLTRAFPGGPLRTR